MELFRIFALALITAMAAILLRASRPELAVPVSVAGGIAVLLMALDSLTGLRGMIDVIVTRYGVNAEYIKAAFKIVGIAYVAQFAAEICRDAGEGAISGKVELAGRLMILTAVMPVIFSILDMLTELMQGV